MGNVQPGVNLIVWEDNEAVIKIIMKGRSKALRHVNRTHRVNIDWLFEFFRMPNVNLKYVNTHFQLADIFIKAVTKSDVFIRLRSLCQIYLADHTSVAYRDQLESFIVKS